MSPESAVVAPIAIGAPAATIGTGHLALILQETLTAVVRLRAGRQPVTDGAAFRAHVMGLLTQADQDARAAGYTSEDARVAIFAVVALLDESVLNSSQPALAGWSRRPLQDELFGDHLAGERFFQHVELLLSRADSTALADVLEVHLLCLRLGFAGRHRGDAGALHAASTRLAERVARLRGAHGTSPAFAAGGDLVPGWRPPDDATITRDPWMRRLTVALGVTTVLALVMLGAGLLSLRGAVKELRALSPPAATTASAAAS